MTAPAPDVLFCTDTFALEHRDRVRAIAPEIGFVELRDGEEVGAADIERITVAFFSHDAWPERAPSYMRVLLSAPNLRWFHTMSAGVDHPVFGMIMDNGARLTTSSGASAAPIARSVLMYLLALARDLPGMLRRQADGDWQWHRWSELEGRSVAVLGFGPIGRDVVRLTTAIGMRPTIVRRAARGDEPAPVRPLAELVDIARGHDAMVVALPLTDDTHRLVSAEVIDALPDHALFVNVGRGELVDQDALTAALAERRLGGAGLDVTDPEPLPADHPLWRLPNVIITPHNSGSTDGTGRRAAEAFLANLERWRAGRPLADEVDRSALP